MFGFLRKLFGNKHERDVKEILPIVDQINNEYKKLGSLSNDELRNKTFEFRAIIKEYLKDIDNDIQELKNAAQQTEDISKKQDFFAEVDKLGKRRNQLIEEILEKILPQAFAVVKETASRFTNNELLEVTATDFDREIAGRLGTASPVYIEGDRAFWKNTWQAAGSTVKWDMIHYDVQLIGGIVLHKGKIAEMATGEGKTLVSTLPAYLNGLPGEGVHIVTVNDYLAKRDAEWNAPLHNFLFLTVDCIDKYKPHSDGRKKAYRADITYGTNAEFGFDYLRDNMVYTSDELVQGNYHYAIVDEVDSVLIDDARTPLIISGPTPKDNRAELYQSLKPAVEALISAQRQLVNDYLKAAKQKIAAGDTGVEEGHGGLELFRAYRGLPKNRALIKYMSEQGIGTILQKTENHYMQEQSKYMFKADAPLLFVIEEKSRNVMLTTKGSDFLGKGSSDATLFVIEDIGAKLSAIESNSKLSSEDKLRAKDEAIRNYTAKTERLHALSQLLKAYTLFDKEEEYVVIDGKVKIVDEQTGRIMEGRRYSDGLHQAIEAKEDVEIEGSTQTYATVTLQNFFRMYHKLAGMTGTAETEAQELWDIYKLDVVAIPTNRPISRDDKNDLVYKTDKEKYNAIIDEIVKLRDSGRPVLVGTTSVDKSELLSRMLNLRGIPHNVLNAKQHAREADIVAQAGQSGIITIATNMAGRGTDIKLSADVKKAGGLAIVGTERHDSRRVDRQLRGRAGRQGDVGSSQFYVSLEDKLMRLFGSERISRLMDRFGHKEGDVLQHGMITKSIERAQKKVEENNFGVRKRLLEYDDVMNIQREAIYKRRGNALQGDRLAIDLSDLFLDLVYELVEKHQPGGQYNAFKEDMLRFFGVEPEMDSKTFRENEFNKLAHGLHDFVMDTYQRKFKSIIDMVMPIIQRVFNDPNMKYSRISIPFTNGIKGIEINADMKLAIETHGKSLVNEIEKSIALAVIDYSWKEHLRNMEELKDQVQNASFAQKDPLVEYKIQSRKLFDRLNSEIAQELASFLFQGMIPIQQEEEVQQAREIKAPVSREVRTNMEQQKEEDERQRMASHQEQNQPLEKVMPRKAEQKIGRNDECPCGSGKKYKNCHGKAE
jgi:preprotein translocase subunit SecA